MVIDPQSAMLFGVGVLVGLLIGNGNFRRKFFKELRSFLTQINRGARELNRSYSGKKRGD